MSKNSKSLNLMPPSKSLLIIGPLPSSKKLGGVVQHMRVLKSLSVLEHAEVYDPGSLKYGFNCSLISIMRKCINIKRKIDEQDYVQVWLNGSIYSMSFLKILLILLLIKSNSKIMIRVFFHGGNFEEIPYLKMKMINCLVRYCLESVYSFHFLSLEQMKGFKKLFPNCPCVLFKNYLPTNRILKKRKSSNKIILFVGRLVKEKGIYELFEAFSRISSDSVAGRSDLELWYVGDGPEIYNLRSKTKKVGSLPIRVLGKLDNKMIESIYAKSYVLVLPTYHREGFPYVVIEAMRAGLPLIVTRSGILADLIRLANNGLIIPPKDSQAIVNALFLLLKDPLLYEHMCHNSYKYFRERLCKNAAEDYYLKLLEETGNIDK